MGGVYVNTTSGDNGDGTITDNLTQLVWQKIPNTETFIWDRAVVYAEGLTIGRISWELADVNFYEKADWPKIYSFFQKHLMEFDSFYQEFNDILITLVD